MGSAPASRHTYRLRFHSLGTGLVREMEFEAYEDFGALAVTRREAANRSATLWRDGEPLCRLRAIPGGGWEIGPLVEEDRNPVS